MKKNWNKIKFNNSCLKKIKNIIELRNLYKVVLSKTRCYLGNFLIGNLFMKWEKLEIEGVPWPKYFVNECVSCDTKFVKGDYFKQLRLIKLIQILKLMKMLVVPFVGLNRCCCPENIFGLFVNLEHHCVWGFVLISLVIPLSFRLSASITRTLVFEIWWWSQLPGFISAREGSDDFLWLQRTLGGPFLKHEAAPQRFGVTPLEKCPVTSGQSMDSAGESGPWAIGIPHPASPSSGACPNWYPGSYLIQTWFKIQGVPVH